MSENFTLTFYKKNENNTQKLYTKYNSVVFGSGMHCSVRIREPSIENTHLQVYLDELRLKAYGSDVFLNDVLLEIGKDYHFSLGDKFRIHNNYFTITKTEPNEEINEKNIIKPVPDHLLEGDSEAIDLKQGTVVSDLYSNRADENNEVSVTAKIIDDGEGNKEVIINREVVTNEFYKGGVIVEEVTEEIHVKEEKEIKIQSTLKSDESLEPLKEVPEIQQAVKILEDGQSDINVEIALEEGDLSTIKEAINAKKDDLNTEIRDTIEPEISVTDTPIDPSLSKKVNKDLGEVVLEKEILSEAEKIVDEKIVEDNKIVAEEMGSIPKSEEELNTEEQPTTEEQLKENIEGTLETNLTVKDSNKKKSSSTGENKSTKGKKVNPNSSILLRTPRRAASQTVDANPLLTPIAKRSKRNSEVPQKKNTRTKK